MVDTYADFCKERVKQDSPVADEVKKEPQGMKTNHPTLSKNEYHRY
jgi:hypothetical protein